MSGSHLSVDQIHQILTYLDLPISDQLANPPLEFLNQHLPNLPPSLLEHFTFLTPKQLTALPTIKHRRLLYSTRVPRPAFLGASEGRLRWPLLWESLGGDPNTSLNDNSINAVEEEQWVSNRFMNPNPPISDSTSGPEAGGSSGVAEASQRQHVKKLGGFLRVLEEERESESVTAAKRMERRLNTLGEEFDDESDDEDETSHPINLTNGSANGNAGSGARVEIKEDQVEVERIFEKRILELFLDGLDTIDYTQIDFIDPPDGDPIARRDAEDKYFNDEEPSRTPNGHEQGQGDLVSKTESRLGEVSNTHSGNETENLSGSGIPQNGQGEYDY
ncbi:uncharacterized protein I303_101939 [Kwoniella dejecticola CBS 10117]|uniref:CCD97-like C-terminal domain-containing protein n=1 Tax=Kwoniella dejecticola CBS 10117 TaxID=1296121 RepID=A0A1A6ACD1_9TREE|nr:uncharacterized protein I303_01925 [Kwoniella dejecticola CBS 10117]OBR87714.1 hypothetical protein I303_01925 [Kwoniella dejecticola CBS 10117]